MTLPKAKCYICQEKNIEQTTDFYKFYKNKNIYSFIIYNEIQYFMFDNPAHGECFVAAFGKVKPNNKEQCYFCNSTFKDFNYGYNAERGDQKLKITITYDAKVLLRICADCWDKQGIPNLQD